MSLSEFFYSDSEPEEVETDLVAIAGPLGVFIGPAQWPYPSVGQQRFDCIKESATRGVSRELSVVTEVSVSKKFCFTDFDCSLSHIATLLSLPGSHGVVYICFALETCPSTGRAHLQGFVLFNVSKRWSAAKVLFGASISFFTCKGTPAENIAYCSGMCQKKNFEPNLFFLERGTIPRDSGQRTKDDWQEILQAARSGDLSLIPAKVLFYSQKLIRSHLVFNLETLDHGTRCIWGYGPSGSGKSRYYRQLYPNAYIKMCNKWWDDYAGEEVVLIEDFDKAHGPFLIHHMKIWCDIYKFRGEVKNSTIMLRPKLIIVTSNYHPQSIWTTPEDLAPITRRFKIIHFSLLGFQIETPTINIVPEIVVPQYTGFSNL